MGKGRLVGIIFYRECGIFPRSREKVNNGSLILTCFRRPQSLYETVRTIYFHHFSWSHKCILCKHYTTFELSLIYSTLYMAFPRQPLLFTETVPHNSYETVEGNHKERLNFFFRNAFAVKIFPKKFRTHWYIACGNRFGNDKFRRRQILYADTLCSTQNITFRKMKWIMTSLTSLWWHKYM